MRTTPGWSLAFLLLAPTLLAQGKERLTFEDTAKPISWVGNTPSASWAWDGRHVELLEGKAKMWFDPATGKLVEPQQKPESAPATAPATPVGRFRATIGNGDVYIETTSDREGGNVGGGRRRGGGRGDQPGADAVKVTSDGAATGKKEQAHASPDGKAVSFVRNHNLVVADTATKTEWAVTADGGRTLFHGILDWVYQEEVYGRGDFQGHWWSPGSDLVAFLSLDESQVKEFTLVDHVPPGFLDTERSVVTEVSSYPKAGDPNPVARVSIADVGSKKVVPVDLDSFGKDAVIARVQWTPDGKTLLLTVQDRIQTAADLCAVDPHTGKVTPWIHEQSETWTNRPRAPHWLADGSFLWLSERTGYQHVYHYRPGGTLLAAVTSGEWQVRTIERVDEKQGVLWFDGTRDGAVDRNLYRIDLDGKNLVRLTPGAGTHQTDLGADGRFLIDRWSAMDRPPTVRVLDGKTGDVVKEVGQADKGQANKYAFSEKRRAVVKARDGFELDASVQLPPDWKAGMQCPVFLPTYSGPNSGSVRDSWNHSAWHQFLAQQGFIVLQVNVRSASGKGHKHIGTCYQHLGVQELKDLEDAVAWVCGNYGGDPGRVCISGWSYGGFITAYALTHSTKFALGIAGAGVYDWRLYDTIYTERYMRTPQENKSGYDETSVIKAAKNLHGHLVLLHGTMDDNVHVQNTIQLLWELEKANKQNFELMLYPRSQHGLSREVDAHSRTYQWRVLARLLDPAYSELERKRKELEGSR